MRLLLFTALLAAACAWTQEELELYDLVEDVGQNFYEFMGISEVRRWR